MFFIRLLELLERKYSLHLLLFLFKRPPKRFKELEKVVLREATRATRLRELEKHELIESILIKEERRFIAYRLTPAGEQIAEKIKEIEKIAEKKLSKN